MPIDREIPTSALRFAMPAQFAAAAAEGGPRRVEGVAYSGEVITGHWFWDAVVFDLAGVEPAGRIPLLVEHDRAQRVGHTSLSVGPDAIRLADGRLLSNPAARGIAEDADEGFPWQLSVHIEPLRIERLEAGATASINGRSVVGPASVFRASRIREVSLTPTGVDHQTEASVFSSSDKDKTMTEVTNTTAPPGDDLAAQVVKLSADLAAATAATEAAIARADAAEAKVAEVQLSTRTAQVKGLFATMGREPTPAAMQPYIEMSEVSFAAISADLSRAIPAAPNHLFSPQGTGGDPATPDPATIAAKATQFKAAQAALGIVITDGAAVAHVLKGV
jgi:hypothetical protein